MLDKEGEVLFDKPDLLFELVGIQQLFQSRLLRIQMIIKE